MTRETGQLTNEVQNGTFIARTYDALGRATGYALGAQATPGARAARPQLREWKSLTLTTPSVVSLRFLPAPTSTPIPISPVPTSFQG